MSRYLVSEHPQGTPEWRQVRAGKATGSMACDILAKIKVGEAAARRDYRVQLVTERLTGAPVEDSYQSKEMLWGTEQEPFARMAYEAMTGEMVREAGFVYLPDLPAGCSVDGFIGADGIFEAKCPKSATHVKYLMAGKLPSDYVAQVTHNLWITGRSFADFVSFDPRMPEELQIFHVRVQRSELGMDAYEAELLKFLAECADLETALRGRLLAKAA